jgi:hypothetical protein
MLISRIEGFEISPYECAVLDFVGFKARIVETNID